MSYKTGFYEGRLGIGLGSTMGMGDGNPRYSLDINGDIRLTGSIVNGDGQILSLTPPEYTPVTVGLDANNSLIYNFEKQGTHTGSQNILIGKHAGTDLTTANNIICLGIEAGSKLTAAHHHIAIGYYALQNCTDRTNAIMIGQQAGRNFSGGDYCIGIGVMAMYNPAGSHNIAMGYSAMQGTSGTQSHTGNIALGYETLKPLTSGTYNIAIGHQASNQMTSGNYNISLGYQTGISQSSANRCIFIGDRAGYSNTTADYNIGIGSLCIYGSCTATHNIGIGYECLYEGPNGNGTDLNAGGRYNVCMGYKCGKWISTGAYNTYIGYNAGCGTTHSTGYQNVLIGCSVAKDIETGYDNTCVGANSAYRLKTGAWNTCIGDYAGQYINSGNYNVCVGQNAGMYIYYGSSNICIGTQTANAYSGAVQNMSNCICIGTYAGPKTTDTSNTCRLYIGSPAAQNGNTYRGEDGSFIYGDYNNTTLTNRFLRVNAKLGVDTNPTAGLDVNVGSANNVGTSEGYLNNAGNTGTWNYGNIQVHIRSRGHIWISNGEIMVSSDRRIKENIIDVPDNLALEMVRNIPCRYYEYKDKLTCAHYEKTIGFIAQEVKEILPMCVSIQKRVIPNEMRILENISWEEITDNSSNQYKLTTDLQDVSGINYKFYVSNDPSGNDEVRKEVIGNPDNTFTFDISYNNVFCYGKEVDDFHTLDKQKLFALNFSATQELDRKVIVLENENAELKAELAAIKQHLGI